MKKLPSITRSPLFENLSQSHHGPFDHFDIAEASSVLNSKTSREICQTCGHSRMWFCYECRRPLDSFQGVFPEVELPFPVDIIKHNRESDGKSTAIHAAILSYDVTIYKYPDIPTYDPDKVVLIFPDAFTFSEICAPTLNGEDADAVCKMCGDVHRKFRFEKVVIIDSTWAQTKRIILDQRVAALTHRAGLTGRESVFWRPQRNRKREYLATIEAIHQVCTMWLDSQGCQQTRKVDNLLYFFKYMHEKISSRYRSSEQLEKKSK